MHNVSPSTSPSFPLWCFGADPIKFCCRLRRTFQHCRKLPVRILKDETCWVKYPLGVLFVLHRWSCKRYKTGVTWISCQDCAEFVRNSDADLPCHGTTKFHFSIFHNFHRFLKLKTNSLQFCNWLYNPSKITLDVCNIIRHTWFTERTLRISYRSCQL